MMSVSVKYHTRKKPTWQEETLINYLRIIAEGMEPEALEEMQTSTSSYWLVGPEWHGIVTEGMTYLGMPIKISYYDGI